MAAALLVVMSKAQKNGRDLRALKDILCSNNPSITDCIRSLPDDGKLRSLKQLEASPSEAFEKSLAVLSHQSLAAGCQPLEVLARSAVCTTHLRALSSPGSVKAARLQRLLAI